MDLQVLAFFVLLGLAAIFDYKKRVIPDFLSCLLWFNALLMINLNALVALALSFPLIWFLNIVFLNLKGREFWGWGDVLIFPPFFAQLYGWGLPYFAILGLLLPMIIGDIRKKQEEEFIAPYLLLIAMIAYGIFGI